MFVLKTDFPSMFTRHQYFPLALHVRCRAQPCRKKIWVTNGVMVFVCAAGQARGAAGRP